MWSVNKEKRRNRGRRLRRLKACVTGVLHIPYFMPDESGQSGRDGPETYRVSHNR
jgi:hypothetical protein